MSIMKLLLLGYLYYFHIAINPIESSDLYTSLEITEKYIENCTQCSNVEPELSCICWKYIDKCLVCCTGVSCCTCYDCTLCWHEQRRLITITQISISLLFGFAIIGLIIVYCKICHRMKQHVARARCIVLQQERDVTTHCSTIEGLRERPPPYSEAVCNTSSVCTSYNSAPPLYTSSYNGTSMQEAPPSYPSTPKPQEKSRGSNESSSLTSVAQHI